MLTNPKVTDQIVQQCVDLGVEHLLDAFRDGHQARSRSEHDQRLAFGSGRMQSQRHCCHPWLLPQPIPQPRWGGHKLMRGMFSLFGFMKVNNAIGGQRTMSALAICCAQ